MEKNLLGYYGEQAALAFVRQEKGRRCNRHLALGLPSPLPFTHTPGQAISLPPKMWACM